MNPRVTDNDQGEITVSLDDKELRGWSYANDTERRAKMLLAREYVEGYCDGKESTERRAEKWFNKACENQALRMVAEAGTNAIMATLKDRISTRLNDYLCEMKPGYDDSIVGFNEAWDIVRKAFDDAAALRIPVILAEDGTK